MLRLNMLFATEARTHFFKILRLVAQGEDVIVINKESGQRFKIIRLEEEPKSGKDLILKQLANSNLKSKSAGEIKGIIETKLNE